MGWKVAIVAGLIVVGVAVIAVMVLMPRSNGAGWRLDPNAMWEQNLPGGGLDPTATVYGGDATSVGIGVTAFGSSTCSPELRGVEIGDDEIRVVVGGPFTVFGACTDDAAVHRFGIVVERDRLPSLPFAVVVRHDDRLSTTEIESLP